MSRNYKNKNFFTLVINEALAKLSADFGYRLVELRRSRPSSTDQSRAAISSTAEASYQMTCISNTVVRLAGGKIHEDNLCHHLRRLGLHENDENHEHIGNLNQALDSLVAQRYLRKTFFYELAERALDANLGDKIKEYILQIVKKDAVSEDPD
ncbi:hypothetical protein MLD38_001673 [Melastoma candidum]|uniref:Uncharacterized protein n=1 Tax=Melastoma candidum TaxID=119954 RepID=A0ACB9SDF4_9MYRT|nr:hypothetical protein MLD38_001673 [Melastoma candidum]